MSLRRRVVQPPESATDRADPFLGIQEGAVQLRLDGRAPPRALPLRTVASSEVASLSAIGSERGGADGLGDRGGLVELGHPAGVWVIAAGHGARVDVRAEDPRHAIGDQRLAVPGLPPLFPVPAGEGLGLPARGAAPSSSGAGPGHRARTSEGSGIPRCSISHPCQLCWPGRHASRLRDVAAADAQQLLGPSASGDETDAQRPALQRLAAPSAASSTCGQLRRGRRWGSHSQGPRSGPLGIGRRERSERRNPSAMPTNTSSKRSEEAERSEGPEDTCCQVSLCPFSSPVCRLAVPRLER